MIILRIHYLVVGYTAVVSLKRTQKCSNISIQENIKTMSMHKIIKDI